MQCISYLAPCVCSSSTARLLVEGWQRDFFLFYIFHSTPTTWQLTRLRCHSLKDWLQVEEGLFSSSVENDGVGFASSWSKSAQCQLKCKLDCNSRTVMPKIILWSPTVVTTLSYPLCCTHCKRGEKLHLLALHLVAITKNIAPWGKDCRWCAPCNMGWWGLCRMARSQLTMRRRNPIQTKSDLGLIVVMIKIVIVVAFANLLEFVPSWTDCMDLQRKLSNESWAT